jgi:hypothetical protein
MNQWLFHKGATSPAPHLPVNHSLGETSRRELTSWGPLSGSERTLDQTSVLWGIILGIHIYIICMYISMYAYYAYMYGDSTMKNSFSFPLLGMYWEYNGDILWDISTSDHRLLKQFDVISFQYKNGWRCWESDKPF